MENVKSKFILAMVCFLIFGAIAYFVVTNDELVFDNVIRQFLYSIRSDELTLFFKAITYLGNWQYIAFLCILLLLYPKTRRSYGFPLSICAILSSVSYIIFKLAFQRVRPDTALHLITQGGYSFPSGHSMTGLLFYGLMIYLIRRKLLSDSGNRAVVKKNRIASLTATILLSFLIFLIGVSRVYLGVHYPTDVIAGWAFGLILLLGFKHIF